MSDDIQHRCIHCGTSIWLEEGGSWVDASEGDGCESASGVHEIADEPEGLYLGPFVNVYLIDRAYGGPEEGGWWYNYGRALRSKQVLSQVDTEDEKVIEQAWCDEENKQRRSDIGSVLSEGKYVVYIEDKPAADFPAETPHYE